MTKFSDLNLNPKVLKAVEEAGYETPTPIQEQAIPYVESEVNLGVPLTRITRHLLGLFQGLPRARLWRRHISENAHKHGAGAEVGSQALALMPRS